MDCLFEALDVCDEQLQAPENLVELEVLAGGQTEDPVVFPSYSSAIMRSRTSNPLPETRTTIISPEAGKTFVKAVMLT
jgi:hypothetical protein